MRCSSGWPVDGVVVTDRPSGAPELASAIRTTPRSRLIYPIEVLLSTVTHAGALPEPRTMCLRRSAGSSDLYLSARQCCAWKSAHSVLAVTYFRDGNHD